MNAELWTMIYIFFPFIAGGILFLVITRFDLCSWMAVPVNGRMFGKNKTWRGLVTVPVLAALAAVAATRMEGWFPQLLFRFSEYNAFLLGLTLGLVFMLSELPNSYMKRRIGIAPGKRPDRNAWLFALIDVLDAAPGVILVFILWTDLTLLFLLEMLLVAVVLKFSINYLLYVAGVRKEPL